MEIPYLSLMRSPPFATLFRSEYWLVGCGMKLHFTVDPADCFLIVRQYLHEGPDRYTGDNLRASILAHNGVCNRFLIIARLHNLAMKMALKTLMQMAFAMLMELDPTMTPSHCVTMASIILREKYAFSPLLREWCFEHIYLNFVTLFTNENWGTVLRGLDTEAQSQWRELVSSSSIILPGIHEETEDKVLESVQNLPEQDQDNALTVIECPGNSVNHAATEDGKKDAGEEIDEETDEEIHEETDEETAEETDEETTDDEWNNVDSAPTSCEMKMEAAKPNALMEIMSATKKAARRAKSWKRPDAPDFNRDSAKARRVMGINAPPMSSKLKIGLLIQ